MGEQKRREERALTYEKLLADLSREMTDRGCLIEAGWIGLRKTWLRDDTPPAQVKALRMAYMAGAQHLFVSIMTILDEGAEPTEADMKRMDMIAAELKAFGDKLAADMPTSGSA